MSHLTVVSGIITVLEMPLPSTGYVPWLLQLLNGNWSEKRNRETKMEITKTFFSIHFLLIKFLLDLTKTSQSL